jgi:putative addiction module component (TIGR02574 family)
MESAVIEKEALQLPVSERALLADRLLQSLGGEKDDVLQAWADEAEHRLDAFHAGRMEALDGPDVLRTLRSKLA